MISRLCEVFPFIHNNCKMELRQLIQAGLSADKTIQSLNSQIISLVNQIQELKAVNDYQAFNLEQKILKLEEELESFKSKREKRKGS